MAETTEQSKTGEIAPAKPAPEARAALAVIGTGGAISVAPRNMGEVIEFAKLMSQAGPCVRQSFRGNVGACLALTLQALRWGMDPFAVVNKAYITTGKAGEQLAFEAQLVHAVVNERAPLQRRLRPAYSGEGVNRRCKIVGWLKGETEPLDYESPTIREIKVKNSPLWEADPDQQLFYYSTRAWARRHVPEILLGVQTADEIEAQERHYGADNARDVTPRPQRPPETELSKASDPFEICAPDGEIHRINDAKEAAEFFIALMGAADTERDLEALWESNSLSGQLRDHGKIEMADQLLAKHDALLEKLRLALTETKAPAAQDAKPAADPKPEAAKPPAKKDAPKSPLRGGDWPTFVAWLKEQLKAMPVDQMETFLKETWRKEWLHIAENRIPDFDAINAMMADRAS
jgi:hypothetical protein